MVHNIFKGLGIALITPFLEDGSVDYDALIRLVDWQLKNGADFFCILATTGETPTLTREERQKIKDMVVDYVQGRVPILMGCGGYNTAAVVEELQLLRQLRGARRDGFHALIQNAFILTGGQGGVPELFPDHRAEPGLFFLCAGQLFQRLLRDIAAARLRFQCVQPHLRADCQARIRGRCCHLRSVSALPEKPHQKEYAAADQNSPERHSQAAPENTGVRG